MENTKRVDNKIYPLDQFPQLNSTPMSSPPIERESIVDAKKMLVYKDGNHRRRSSSLIFPVQRPSLISHKSRLGRNGSIVTSNSLSFSKSGDYRSFKSSEERVVRAMSSFSLQVLDPFVDSRSSSIISNPDHFKNEMASFFETHRFKGLSSDEVDDLCRNIIVFLAVSKKEFDPYHSVMVFIQLCLSFFDTVTDVLITIQLVSTSSKMAYFQLGCLFTSFVLQSIFSFILGQPLWVFIVGLLGFKPVVEAWREASRDKPFPNQKMGNTNMLFGSYMIEITTESIPQSLIQSVNFILLPEARSIISYVSILSSIVTVGFLVAYADRQLDTNKLRRRKEPLFVGYVPDNEFSSVVQFLVHFVFFTIYGSIKIMCLSILVASTSVLHLLVLFLFEFLSLLLIRMWYRNWRYYMNGADGIIFSLLSHMCISISMIAAPFLVYRHPMYLTPRLYIFVIIYMMLANFVIIYMSFNFFTPTSLLNTYHSIPEPLVWKILIIGSVVALISWSIGYYLVPHKLKPSFYEHLTFRDYLINFYWNHKDVSTDDQNNIITDKDHIRAVLPIKYSKFYRPDDLLISFYSEKWQQWCDDPPEWFDEKFKAKIPFELLTLALVSVKPETPQKDETTIKNNTNTLSPDLE